MNDSLGLAVRVAVGRRVDYRGSSRWAVACRGMPWELAVGFAVEIALEIAVDISAEIAMASAMGRHDSPMAVRGSSWPIRGSPWKAVERTVECRGFPWVLPRRSAKQSK